MSVRQRSGMYGVHAVVSRGHGVCPLVGGCPLVGVSIIGGSTVPHTLCTALVEPQFCKVPKSLKKA